MTDNSTPAPAANPFSKPVLNWNEFWFEMVGVTESTARKITRGPDTPRFFLIGRQRHIRLDDALAWLEHMAASKPYTPRKNRRGGAEK